MVKNKTTKIFSINSGITRGFSSRNKPLHIFFILTTIILSIILIYFLYRWVNKAIYIYRLKTDFDKLKSIGVDVKNYNILYYPENKKKYIVNRAKVVGKENTLFRNKKAIGFVPDKYIVLDIDTKEGIDGANFLIEKVPKDTVSEKTPNGYHYYFENDTGKPVETYVQLTIDDVKYSVDILGRNSLVTMSPTNINGKDYKWINSIFTHTPAKLSENTWLIDLIKDNKPFFRKFDNVDINLTIKGALVIVDNINIEDYFRFTFGSLKEYSKKIKLLGGIIYLYDDNYYFFTRAVFNKIKNKIYLMNELKRVVDMLKPSYIIDLSIIYSNYLEPLSLVQVSSAIIHNDYNNYKAVKNIEDYIQSEHLDKETKYLIRDVITINNFSNNNVKQLITYITGTDDKNDDVAQLLSKNKILLGSESIYLSMFLSNYFNIPSLCLGIVSNIDPELGKSPIKETDKLATTFFTLF
jgi:hypothetical protein